MRILLEYSLFMQELGPYLRNCLRDASLVLILLSPHILIWFCMGVVESS
jgi:hypothetical protein